MQENRLSIVRHTQNFEVMRRFYRDRLGMNEVESWNEPGNQGVLLSFGATLADAGVEVLQLGQEAQPEAKPVNVVLSIEVVDVDNWCEILSERGVTIARGLEDVPWGHRSFGVDDPDDFRLWFYQDMQKD